jgi:hypothetical protein
MVSERPTVINRELTDPTQPRGWGSHRLHSAEGPAIAWSDGWGVWAWHGIRVPQHVIEAPETLTTIEILAEENAEVRRVMIERFGAARLLREGNADKLDADEDQFGRPRQLLRLPVPGDEDIVMLTMVNSTPEPDGTYKDYYLRVPPTMHTCRQAMAWTWGMGAKEYAPVIET